MIEGKCFAKGVGMINSINNTGQLMPVVLQKEVVLRKETLIRPSGNQPKEYVILENRREIKPDILCQKGVLIDYYI
jgi:hypothetical protein